MSASAAAHAFTTGFLVSGALIVAIGAQNAFVLRQGILGHRVGPVVAFCALADAALIGAGMLGMGRLLARLPWLTHALTLGGALFLLAYGMLALRRACRPGSLQAGAGTSRPALRTILLQAAAFTLLNPHVYLDTVVLVGSIGAAQPFSSRGWFFAGASLASATWFTLLGLGARRLAPWLARPSAWRLLEGTVGVTMVALALALWRQAGDSS